MTQRLCYPLTDRFHPPQDKGQKIIQSMRQLEREKLKQMEQILSRGVEEPNLLVNLFPSCVQEEMNLYSKTPKT